MNIVSANVQDFNNGKQIFDMLELKFAEEGRRVAREMIKKQLEQWDELLLTIRPTEIYRCHSKRKGTIKSLMGEVSYNRHYYRYTDETGPHFTCLVDELFGLDGKGLVSDNLKEMIVSQCLDVSFGKAAETISKETGQSISRGGVWNVFQDMAAHVAKQEESTVAQVKTKSPEMKITSKVLFEEMDGIWLSMQRKDRPKKIGKREIKMATYYSGWEETSKGRFETVGKVAYAGFDEPKEFHRKREAQVSRWYATDDIEVRILNGDGADWIRGTDEDVVIQLDQFHRSRSIIRGLQEKEDRAKVNDLLKMKDVSGALLYIANLAVLAQDENKKKRIVDLYNYLENNREYLLPWYERDVELPEPPTGIIYRGLGTQEHSGCDIITQRMKHRKASWSIKGGGLMAKMLCLRATTSSMKKVHKTRLVWEVVQMYEPLSAAQTPKYDGKGNDGGTAHGGWPFENTFTTESRKAMRNIFHIKKP